MLSAVFLPFALVHFITFAILIYKSSARQIFDFSVFPEKPTSCQLFTFLGHISLLKIMQQPNYISLMMLFSKKTYLAVLQRSIFSYSPYTNRILYFKIKLVNIKSQTFCSIKLQCSVYSQMQSSIIGSAVA